jgi:hypothetical protein
MKTKHQTTAQQVWPTPGNKKQVQIPPIRSDLQDRSLEQDSGSAGTVL